MRRVTGLLTYALSTYALWSIRAEMNEAIRRYRYEDAISQKKYADVTALTKMMSMLSMNYKVDYASLAAALTWLVKKVEELIGYLRRDISIETPITDGEDICLKDLLSDEQYAMEPALDAENLHPRVRQAIETLPDKKRQYVLARYFQGKTRAQSAGELGLSAERGRQIELEVARALKRQLFPESEKSEAANV
jgi:RNA polymerase sigma factor (sigma-70 family)